MPPPIASFIPLLVLLCGASGYNPDLPGGLKLIVDGETLSVTTDVCPGGIFFKQPVYAQLTCFHGFFLRRPNGCAMAGSDIVGGSNYVCESVNKNQHKKVQAFVPITNPESALDHTIALFDEADTLKNFRRYSYVKGLEGEYAPGNPAAAVGALVANVDRVPKTIIDGMCYESTKSKSGSSIMAFWEKPVLGRQGTFKTGCDAQAADFPWETTKKFAYSQGYTEESLFEDETEATIPQAVFTQSETLDVSKYEIWGGMAYCLQTRLESTSASKYQMSGLVPGLESFAGHCTGTSQAVEGKAKDIKAPSSLLERVKRQSHSRVKRLTRPQADDMVGCISNCFGQGGRDCQRSIVRNGGADLQICPPHCGGIKHEA